MLKITFPLILVSQMAFSATSTLLIENKSCDVNRAEITRLDEDQFKVRVCKNSTGVCETVAEKNISLESLENEIKFQERFFIANGVLMVLPFGHIARGLAKLPISTSKLIDRLLEPVGLGLPRSWIKVKGGMIGYGSNGAYKEVQLLSKADNDLFTNITKIAPQISYEKTTEGTLHVLRRADGSITKSMDAEKIRKMWEVEDKIYYPKFEAAMDTIRAKNMAQAKVVDSSWRLAENAKTFAAALASVDSLDKATQLLEFKVLLQDTRRNETRVLGACLDEIFKIADDTFRREEIGNTMDLEGYTSTDRAGVQ